MRSHYGVMKFEYMSRTITIPFSIQGPNISFSDKYGYRHHFRYYTDKKEWVCTDDRPPKWPKEFMYCLCKMMDEQYEMWG